MSERHSFQLDCDDEGEPSENPAISFAEQDDAFCAAMRKAIARGKEKPPVGVKPADPNDIRYVRRVSVPSHVLTASSANINA